MRVDLTRALPRYLRCAAGQRSVRRTSVVIVVVHSAISIGMVELRSAYSATTLFLDLRSVSPWRTPERVLMPTSAAQGLLRWPVGSADWPVQIGCADPGGRVRVRPVTVARESVAPHSGKLGRESARRDRGGREHLPPPYRQRIKRETSRGDGYWGAGWSGHHILRTPERRRPVEATPYRCYLLSSTQREKEPFVSTCAPGAGSTRSLVGCFAVKAITGQLMRTFVEP